MANEVKVGGLKAEVKLDTSKWDQGIQKVKRDLDDSKVKGKEMSLGFKDMGTVLEMAGGGLATLGAGLITALTAGITQSSTFQAKWAELGAQFKQTSETLGQTFKPEIDALGNALIGTLKYVEQNKDALRGLSTILETPFKLSWDMGRSSRAGVEDFLADVTNTVRAATEGEFFTAGEAGKGRTETVLGDRQLKGSDVGYKVTGTPKNISDRYPNDSGTSPLAQPNIGTIKVGKIEVQGFNIIGGGADLFFNGGG